MNLPTTATVAKPKLLLLSPYFFPQNYGGAVRIYDTILHRLDAFECHVLAERLGAQPEALAAADSEAAARGYTIHRADALRLIYQRSSPIARLWELNGFFRAARRDFAATLRQVNPAIVICGATYRTGWLMERLPAPIAHVNYIHGEELTMRLDEGRHARWLLKRQIRCFARAALNVVVSRFTADQLAACVPAAAARTRIVPNFIDAAEFTPPADRDALRRRLGFDGRTVLLTVARLIPRKGIDHTLRALAGARLPADWLYVIAGRGPEEQNLRRLACELGLADRVQFRGYLPHEDLPAINGAADLFIQANRAIDGDTEGFGIVFLEANACATPVIGGIAGGTADAIVDGETGLRVDGEDVGAIRAAIERLAGEPDLRRAFGQAGRRRVEAGFSADACAARLQTLLLSLLKER